MTAMQVADLFFTEDRVIVVLLDEASGLVLRSPSPDATHVMIQVPNVPDFRTVPLGRLAFTEIKAVLCETREWGGEGAWPAYRARMLR